MKKPKSMWSKWHNPIPDINPFLEVRVKDYNTKNYNVSVFQEKDLLGIPKKSKSRFTITTYKCYSRKGIG